MGHCTCFSSDPFASTDYKEFVTLVVISFPLAVMYIFTVGIRRLRD